jgi:hypothetical protein
MTIFGSDVSHYDGADTRPMFSDGIVFQTHKAGGDKDDAELGSWWGYVKGYRSTVLLGAYWVLYPGDPTGRADKFIARLDSQCPGWRDGPFILQADCEKWNGDSSTAPNVSEVNAFCDRLVAKLPKLRPIGYLPDWVYGDISKFKYPLWSSKYVDGAGHYKALYPGDSSSKWAAYGGRSPSILQYSSSATIANQTTCDANAFRGTLTELTELLAPGWAEEDLVTAYDDCLAALKEFHKSTEQKSGYPESVVGNRAGVQGVPNPFRAGETTNQYKVIGEIGTRLLQVQADLATLVGKDFTDETAIVQGVLSGLAGAEGAAETIADAVVAALPPDLAQQVVDEMSIRLAPAEDPNG